jgi:hypothetical protein
MMMIETVPLLACRGKSRRTITFAQLALVNFLTINFRHISWDKVDWLLMKILSLQLHDMYLF